MEIKNIGFYAQLEAKFWSDSRQQQIFMFSAVWDYLDQGKIEYQLWSASGWD